MHYVLHEAFIAVAPAGILGPLVQRQREALDYFAGGLMSAPILISPDYEAIAMLSDGGFEQFPSNTLFSNIRAGFAETLTGQPACWARLTYGNDAALPSITDVALGSSMPNGVFVGITVHGIAAGLSAHERLAIAGRSAPHFGPGGFSNDYQTVIAFGQTPDATHDGAASFLRANGFRTAAPEVFALACRDGRFATVAARSAPS
jgi:hypothetical protein